MGLIQKIKRSKLLKRSSASVTDDNSWLIRHLQGAPTSAGAYVNEDTALTVSAVYACVKIIAWTIASLPIGLYKELKLEQGKTGKELATDHPIHYLLSTEPNAEQTSFEFMALMSISQLLYGAGVAEIEFDKGVPVALWPIPTYSVRPQRTPQSNLLVYEVDTGGNPWKPFSKMGERRYLWPDQVIVFPAMHSQRDRWLSPIALHRETVGMSIALREFGNKTFGQGTNPAGLVTCDSPLGKEAENDLISRLHQYKGLSNSHRLMFLNAGVHFERIGLPPEDAQFLESQKYNSAQIGRIYSVPPHLLGEQEKSTTWGSGLEEINQGFISYTLNPYIVQHQQELKRKLLPRKSKYFPKISVDKLVLGNILDRYQAYSIGRTHSFLSPDEIREREDLNPMRNGHGDRYDMQTNMVNVDIADEIAKQQSQPPQPTQGEEDNGEDNEEE